MIPEIGQGTIRATTAPNAASSALLNRMPVVQSSATEIVTHPESATGRPDVFADLVQQPPSAFNLGLRIRPARPASVETVPSEAFEETPHEC